MTDLMGYLGAFVLGILSTLFWVERSDRDDDGLGGGLLP
jgi:hypothetical protein